MAAPRYVTIVSGALTQVAMSEASANEVAIATGTTGKIDLSFLPESLYSVQVPVTGFSITVAAAIYTQILNPAGTLATGSVKMPASPVPDGFELVLASTQTVTTLTMTANTSQTLKNGLTTIAAGGFAKWKFQLSSLTWFRIG